MINDFRPFAKQKQYYCVRGETREISTFNVPLKNGTDKNDRNT